MSEANASKGESPTLFPGQRSRVWGGAILVLLASVSQAVGQVLRGGSFNNNQYLVAASYRNNNPNNDNNNYGFRVVLAAHTFLTLQKAMLLYRLLPKVAGVYGCPLAAKAEG